MKNESRRLFISVFRGSFKTTVVLGFCLFMFCWAVADGRPLSIVYNTATKDNATQFMEDFRQTLLTCKWLHWIFPELPRDKAGYLSWHLYRIEFQNVKFHVASLDTQQVGRHYEIIINDDLVNDKNAFSDVEREGVRRKWAMQKAILTKYRMLGTGLEIDIGTPYHKGDLISQLIREDRGYDKFIVPYAVTNRWNHRVLTFPEMYCWEDFEDKKRDMGESLFATQYALTVLDEGDRVLHEKWIRFWDTLPDNYNRVLIADAAGTEKEKNDPWGFLIFDIDERSRILVRHVEETHLTPYKGLKHFEELALRFRTDENYFEREHFAISCQDIADFHPIRAAFGMIDHKNEPPEKRVYRLKQYFETGRILFGHGHELLISEALYWPDFSTDHVLMCLAHALKVLNPPVKGKKRYEETRGSDFDDELREFNRRQKAITAGPVMDHYF